MIAMAPGDLWLLVGITWIWGLNLVVSKSGLAEIPPFLFTFLRFAILALLLAPLLRVRRGQMSALVVAGLLCGAFNFALSFAGLHLAHDVASVAIASQLSVPFTTLLSVALLDEVVRWRRWSGIILAFGGVAVTGGLNAAGVRWQSLALVVASAFVSSLGVIAVKRLRGISPLELQGWFAWTGLPVLLPLTWLLEHPTLAQLQHVSAGAWGSLAYTTFGSSLVAHSGYFYLIHRYPVSSVAPLTVLSPLFSVLFGVLLLDEQLTRRVIVGGACTLLGVLIITLRERRIADVGT
jgi:O-acetylserine/cysteine efflux transporter